VTAPRRDVDRPPVAAAADGTERPDVLSLHVSDLRRLFNSMDPAPFRERDLDPEAATYIVEWAEEAPARQPLAMVVHLGVGSDADADAETVLIRESVHEYFQRRAAATRRQLQQLLSQGRISLLIALVFLGVVIIVGDWLAATVARERTAKLIEDSLVIGAWVALWRPLEIFLYDWWPIRDEARLYSRLGAMDIRVAHGPALPNAAAIGHDGIRP
jgi:hypothetical protein